MGALINYFFARSSSVIPKNSASSRAVYKSGILSPRSYLDIMFLDKPKHSESFFLLIPLRSLNRCSLSGNSSTLSPLLCIPAVPFVYNFFYYCPTMLIIKTNNGSARGTFNKNNFTQSKTYIYCISTKRTGLNLLFHFILLPMQKHDLRPLGQAAVQYAVMDEILGN